MNQKELDELMKQIDDCDARIAKDSSDYLAYFERGLIKSELNLHKDAIKDFSKTIRLKPDLAAAYLNRSCEYEAINELALADSDSDKYNQLMKQRYKQS